jgi:hypothetical protein
MKPQSINRISVASILLATVFFTNTYAQEAEKIYHTDYSKLSIVLQPARLMAGSAYNLDGSTYPSMEFTESFSIQAGVYYNFAQYNNFNFKTGLIAKMIKPFFDLNISDNDIGYDQENYLTDIDFFYQGIVSIPFKTEYYFNLNPKLNLVVGAGIDLNLIIGYDGMTKYSVAVGDVNSGEVRDIFTAYDPPSETSINFSGEISAGINYKTNFSLIQIELFYNKSFGSPVITGDYYIYDLAISPDKQGIFEVKNDFYGIGFIFSPKKGWLKKKP